MRGFIWTILTCARGLGTAGPPVILAWGGGGGRETFINNNFIKNPNIDNKAKLVPKECSDYKGFPSKVYFYPCALSLYANLSKEL